MKKSDLVDSGAPKCKKLLKAHFCDLDISGPPISSYTYAKKREGGFFAHFSFSKIPKNLHFVTDDSAKAFY